MKNLVIVVSYDASAAKRRALELRKMPLTSARPIDANAWNGEPERDATAYEFVASKHPRDAELLATMTARKLPMHQPAIRTKGVKPTAPAAPVADTGTDTPADQT